MMIKFFRASNFHIPSPLHTHSVVQCPDLVVHAKVDEITVGTLVLFQLDQLVRHLDKVWGHIMVLLQEQDIPIVTMGNTKVVKDHVNLMWGEKTY